MNAQQYLKIRFEEVAAKLGLTWPAKASIEPPKDSKFGDLACNAAMIMAKEAKRAPRDIAVELCEALLAVDPLVATAEVAGAGFINVRFAPAFWHQVLQSVLQQGDSFGACPPEAKSGKPKKRVQIEFVSANPTGPLHIGHARGAAVGDSLGRLLRFTGQEVSLEYYINDAGGQMRTLGLSVWLRALELAGKEVEFPEDCYKGQYIIDIARDMLAQNATLPSLTDSEGCNACFEYAHRVILDGIKQDLQRFGVEFDAWYSERNLLASGALDQALKRLDEKGLLFEEEGALWFESTSFGDDKDRVLRKSTGDLTYFATDIAYHEDKLKRGFDLLVDIWGADHHGYIPRLRAAIQALGHDPACFEVIIIQLVNWLSNGQQMAMSTRAGRFELLCDVLDEVGVDAARFMFLSRKSDSPLDFDLDLVKSQSMDNPVYYVQYAHARVYNLLGKGLERGVIDQSSLAALSDMPLEFFAPLSAEEDLELIRALNSFGPLLQESAAALAPHHISFYLMELAGLLHRYYAAIPILKEADPKLLAARLALLFAVGQVLRNGLALLGVSAPQSM